MTSSSTLSTNDAALAILAEHQLQPRILGPASPESGARIVSNQPTGQWINPAMLTNPQSTVNSSTSSAPTPVVTTGAGEVAGATVTDGAAILDASIPNVAVSNTTTTGTASATLVPGAFAAGPGVATSTTALATTIGTTSGVTLTPTVSSGAVSNATVASSASATSSATGIAPVRVVRSANGSLTITNVTTHAETRP